MGALLKRWRSGNQTVTLVGKLCRSALWSFFHLLHTSTHGVMHSYTHTHTKAMRINAALACSLRGRIGIG